jgi:hypothetical protein
MYHGDMEMIITSTLFVLLLTVFFTDASRKRREFLQKQSRA